MEQKVIVKNQERCIFLIRESNIDFYFVIPNSKKVNLVLGIFPNVQEEMIKNLGENSERAIVVPIISFQVLNGVKEKQNSYYEYLDRFLSVLINTSYKILSFNHVEVSEKILLHHHLDYSDFNQWFVEKYHGRVELVNLEMNQEPKPSTFQGVESGISVPNPTPNLENKKMTSDSKEGLMQSSETDVEIHTKEPGFVSYVLLGVVVAVVSLIFLYFII